jgi:LacI family transcriptional regulator
MRSRRKGRPVAGRPVLALVCAFEQPDGWRNSYSATLRLIREGALSRAEQHGYQGQEFWLHQDGMSAERFSEMLRARGIQGLLLGPLPDGVAPPELRWDYFSAVSLSVPFKSLTLHTVCNDHYFSSYRAVHECHRLGYRRPGLVLRQSHRSRFQGRWEAGFFSAQYSLPGIIQTRPHFPENLEELSRFDLANFERWLDREKPDVIVTHGTDFVEDVLRRLGRKVPTGIGLAGLSCPQDGDHFSGIYQHGRAIGATATDVLIGMVERHEKGLPGQAVTTMVEGLWNPGETLIDSGVAASRPPRRSPAHSAAT